MSDPIHEFVVRRRVEFSETDMAGIVHFSAYFKWMEAAEHALFRHLGQSVVMRIGDRRYGWPRVHAECDWQAPLKFEDEFDVKLLVREVRRSSIIFDFAFLKLSGESPQRVGRGSFTTVCVSHDGDGKMKAAAIPVEIAGRLQPAPAEALAELAAPGSA